MAKNILDLLPSLPSTSARTIKACECGCGGTTTRTFAPGHDARLKGVVIRVVSGLITLDQVQALAAQAYGGDGTATRKAVEETLKNAARLAKWQIKLPVVEEEKVG